MSSVCLSKSVERLDAHASTHDVARVVQQLVSGEDIALVTDAGTPVVSDLGTELVRAAVEAGVHEKFVRGMWRMKWRSCRGEADAMCMRGD